jgi:hypothetical protein
MPLKTVTVNTGGLALWASRRSLAYLRLFSALQWLQ